MYSLIIRYCDVYNQSSAHICSKSTESSKVRNRQTVRIKSTAFNCNGFITLNMNSDALKCIDENVTCNRQQYCAPCKDVIEWRPRPICKSFKIMLFNFSWDYLLLIDKKPLSLRQMLKKRPSQTFWLQIVVLGQQIMCIKPERSKRMNQYRSGTQFT